MKRNEFVALTAITLSSFAVSFLSCNNTTANFSYMHEFDFVDTDNANTKNLESNLYSKYLTNNSFNRCIDSQTCAYTPIEVGSMPDEMKENFGTLDYFETLEDDWDEFGSLAPQKAIIAIAREWIKRLEIQPEIFPTPDGGIQFEYTIGKNQHLNIEIFSEEKLRFFQMFSDRTYAEDVSDLSFENIKRRIDKFYGRI